MKPLPHVTRTLPTWQRVLSVLRKTGLYNDINFGRTGQTRTEYDITSRVMIGEETKAPLQTIHKALGKAGIAARLERSYRSAWAIYLNVSNPPRN